MASDGDMELVTEEQLNEASASLEKAWTEALVAAGLDPEQAKVEAGKNAGKVERQLALRLQQETEAVPGSRAKFRVLVYYKPDNNRDFDSMIDQISNELRRGRGESTESTGAGLEGVELSEEEFLGAVNVIESAAEVSVEGLLHQLEREGGETIDHLYLADAVVARLNSGQIQEIAKRDDVKLVAGDRRMFTELDKSTQAIHVNEARTQALLGEGRGVVVALLDGEVNSSHKDLAGRVVRKRNYTEEPWGRGSRHGTHVAGIIAGNGTKYGGVAPKATIWNYKLFPTGEAESTESASLEAAEGSTGAAAIQDAVKDGAKILNCSWGISGAALDGNSVWALAAERAAKLGVLVVKSAGNKGPDEGSLTTPADARGDVIVVGAVDRGGTAVTSFSSRGPTADGRPKPDICAPGERIMSASETGNGYRALSGTSMATPHVSGLAALLLERHPKWKAADMKRALMETADALTGDGDASPNVQGKGLVNALKAAGGAVPPAGDAEPPADLAKAVDAASARVEQLRLDITNIKSLLPKSQ